MRTVATHPDKGLFLGVANGRTWWTGECVRLSICEAATFPGPLEAAECMCMHLTQQELELLELHDVPCESEHLTIGQLHKYGFGRYCDPLLFFLLPVGFA